MNKQIKNILIIGKTGNGKSTLANVLSNTNLFVESSGSTSQTKTLQAEQFEHQGQTYQVIDTLGLSDTSLTEKEVLFKIAEIANYLEDGQLCQVLFVIDKRISKEEQEVYKLLKEVILTDNETKELVTLVRSNFAKFRSQRLIQQDLEQIKQDSKLSEILANCRDIIHVNNPPLEEVSDDLDSVANDLANKLRTESRRIVLDFLDKIPNYQIKNITEIKDRVDNYQTELELVQAALTQTKDEMNQLVTMIGELQAELTQQQSKVATSENEKQQQKILLLELTKQIKSLESQLADKHLREEQIKQGYQSLENEVTKLRREQIELDDQIKELARERLDLEKERRRESIASQATIDGMQTRIDELQATIEELEIKSQSRAKST